MCPLFIFSFIFFQPTYLTTLLAFCHHRLQSNLHDNGEDSKGDEDHSPRGTNKWTLSYVFQSNKNVLHVILITLLSSIFPNIIKMPYFTI